MVLAVVALVLLAGCAGGGLQENSLTATQQSTTGVQTQTVNGSVDVHFINVGQSVSTLIVGPSGETMLVDTGHYRDDGEYVLEYLKAHNITRIDYLVTSHNDADHIGGNAQVIEYYETQANGIGAVYDPGIAASTQTYQAYLDAVEQYNVTLYETRAGDQIPFKGVNVSVLGPPEPYLEDGARNENSIVLKLGFGQTSFLLTGDAEQAEEEYLVNTYGDRLNVTVLKAGHHGSASSTGTALLDVASPKAVIVSSGWNNQYGHPATETLERLAARDLPTYWTATHGTIVLTSNGTTVTVKTQQAAPTDPMALRDGEPIEPGTLTGVEIRAVLRGSGDWQAPTTTTSTDSTTTVADGGVDPTTLDVVDVQANAPEGQPATAEYVVFKNTGNATLDLGGWTVADSADHTYTIPDGVTLPPNETITLHTSVFS
ncbi:competence protein [Halarchaeum grantii]|uniref:Competence protein n=1 Tax=Halarchaeum grantii TaxID=1193105 RepID=A0A830F5T7_9EURY|nr:competence protein [Halarchaeum grantii]